MLLLVIFYFTTFLNYSYAYLGFSFYEQKIIRKLKTNPYHKNEVTCKIDEGAYCEPNSIGSSGIIFNCIRYDSYGRFQYTNIVCKSEFFCEETQCYNSENEKTHACAKCFSSY
ncbi:hypothetical protein GvMRE_IIg463 [endosymbiont GvMRE of Glomus versiforme]|nr:hypothetical protein GvMRE_IIg463 [endosymbiont GvMRE of Glomus versiforme]